MKLIVGLGNPGKEYIGTRHNFGYAAVSALRKAIAPGARWKKEPALQAEISRAKTAGEEVVLMRPLTFMNRSGESVAAFLESAPLLAGDVWIIHDELDLELGSIKINDNASAGGHRGVDSIHQATGNTRFPRFRLGIGRPATKGTAVERYVLSPFDRAERRMAAIVVDTVVGAVSFAIQNGISAAANRYNGKPLFDRSQMTE